MSSSSSRSLLASYVICAKVANTQLYRRKVASLTTPILKVLYARCFPRSYQQSWCGYPLPPLPISAYFWNVRAWRGKNVSSGRIVLCIAPWLWWGAFFQAHAPCVSKVSLKNQLTGMGVPSTYDRREIVPFRKISPCRLGRWRPHLSRRTWVRALRAPSLWRGGIWPSSWSAWRSAFSLA